MVGARPDGVACRRIPTRAQDKGCPHCAASYLVYVETEDIASDGELATTIMLALLCVGLLSVHFHATANEPIIAALVVIGLVVMVMSIVRRGPRLWLAMA
jgi:hypothetical protein